MGRDGTVVYSEVERSSLLAWGNVLLRWRALIVGLSLGTFIVVLVHSVLFVRPQYLAQAKFMLQSNESPTSRLSVLAAEFGVSVRGSGSRESPGFYEALAETRDLLRTLAGTQFRTTNPDGTGQLVGTLPELLGARGKTETERMNATIVMLRERITAQMNLRTGLISLETQAPSAQLAESINAGILELMNGINLRSLQSNAAAERKFVETRLEVAQSELLAAENELQEFLDRNQRYQDSPQLSFHAARLQRRVTFRQEVYTSLAQAHEEARIAEVRNTPVITVVEHPNGSGRRTGWPAPARALVGGALAGCLAVMLAFALDHVKRQTTRDPDDYREFQQLSRAAMAQLRPSRWFKSPTVPR